MSNTQHSENSISFEDLPRILRQLASIVETELRTRKKAELPGMFDHEVVPFGKYKGRSFIELWRSDKIYCEFIAGMDIKRPGDTTEKMRLFIAQRKDRA